MSDRWRQVRDRDIHGPGSLLSGGCSPPENDALPSAAMSQRPAAGMADQGADQGLSRGRRAVEPSRLGGVGDPRQVSRKEILITSSSAPLGTEECPGSVSGAPNLPPGFADTFTIR
jgi:hypothetical protein